MPNPDSSLSERGKPRLLNKPAIDQIDPKRTLAFLGHLVLYEPNDRCDDRPGGDAANCLTEESTNIHAAGCIAQNRQKRGEDLTSDAASRARNAPEAWPTGQKADVCGRFIDESGQGCDRQAMWQGPSPHL